MHTVNTPPAMRHPGLAQGLTLISLAWVSTIAAVVIAPILPQMHATFIAAAHVDILISLVATGPSLLVAVLAVPFGIWADKVGRRRILLLALLAYGIAGTAPLWLPQLNQIVVSRIALGLAEAAIMTIGTALLGDYYLGRQRERWLAAQTGIAPITAVILVLIGGLLGGFGWRTPFYVYAFGFVLFPLILALVWEPPLSSHSSAASEANAVRADFRWSKPLWISGVIVLSTIMFMVTVIQFSFLVNERGMTTPQTIGLWSAAVTVANPLGSLLFALTTARFTTSTKMTIAYSLYAIGFIIMATVPTIGAAIAGAFVANLGGGFYLPTAINWLLSTLPPALVGRGSGLWTAANFLGQFLGPLAILGLVGLTGTLSHAILTCGLLCAAAALALLAGKLLGSGAPSQKMT